MAGGIKQQATKLALKTALKYLEKNPQENLPKLLNLAEKQPLPDDIRRWLPKCRGILNDPDSNWYRWLMGLWQDLDQGVRQRFFENLLVHVLGDGMPKRHALREQYGCNVPWIIMMDPTSACNLHCEGCWAAEYGSNFTLGLQTMEKIIRQGKGMGVYMYFFSGGEPLVCAEDILKLCRFHPECEFFAFTNGTLLDDKIADAILRVKNFIPILSIEGPEAETDALRGNGIYRQVLAAMDRLRERKLPFGISCCYTRENTEGIISESYIDKMIAEGARFAWFSTYMPVGAGAREDLIVTAAQRRMVYERVREYRETKPLVILDLCNDGNVVQGCIGGGKKYLQINANGDVLPCAFVPYSDRNIHECSLLDCVRSPFFMQFARRQPFNDNLLRPCPVLDSPDVMVDMVRRTQAHSTHAQRPEDVEVYAGRCREQAEAWRTVADELRRASEKD